MNIGPIPPPTLLSQYNQVIPDGAERILAMAEKDAAHQIYMEKTAIHLKAEEIKRETKRIFHQKIA